MVRNPPVFPDKQLAATGTRPQRRVRSDPALQSTLAAAERRCERLFTAVDVSGEGSSLMDDDDDDDDAVDELELFDVALG